MIIGDWLVAPVVYFSFFGRSWAKKDIPFVGVFLGDEHMEEPFWVLESCPILDDNSKKKKKKNDSK